MPAAANEDPHKLPPNMGYRTWNVEKGWLHSPVQDTKWESPVIHGECSHNLPGITHGSDWQKCFNDPDHLCGIHSLKHPQALTDEGYFTPLPFHSSRSVRRRKTGPQVIGTIRHHGTTFEGDKGYRSQNATIDTLWTPYHKVADQLEQNYPGVQVIRKEHPYFTGVKQRHQQRFGHVEANYKSAKSEYSKAKLDYEKVMRSNAYDVNPRIEAGNRLQQAWDRLEASVEAANRYRGLKRW